MPAFTHELSCKFPRTTVLVHFHVTNGQHLSACVAWSRCWFCWCTRVSVWKDSTSFALIGSSSYCPCRTDGQTGKVRNAACNWQPHAITYHTSRLQQGSNSDICVSKINLVSVTVSCVTGSFSFLLYFSFEILFRFSFSCQFSNHSYFSFSFSFCFRFRVYYIDQ